MSNILSAPLDLSGVEPETKTGWEPVPAGNYTAMCTEIDATTSQNAKGTYEMLRVTFQILDGAQKGKTIRDNLIIRHSGSPKAQEIGQKRLRAWIDAIGADLNLTDINVLKHKPVTIGVRVDPPRTDVANGKEYGPSNRVTTISAPSNTVVPMSAPVNRTTAPTAPTKPAAPAPQAVAAATAPAGALPWQR